MSGDVAFPNKRQLSPRLSPTHSVSLSLSLTACASCVHDRRPLASVCSRFSRAEQRFAASHALEPEAASRWVLEEKTVIKQSTAEYCLELSILIRFLSSYSVSQSVQSQMSRASKRGGRPKENGAGTLVTH